MVLHRPVDLAGIFGNCGLGIDSHSAKPDQTKSAGKSRRMCALKTFMPAGDELFPLVGLTRKPALRHSR